MQETTDTAEFIGFGAAEMAYILSELDERGGNQAAATLRLDRNDFTPQVVSLGASSLFARGMLDVAPDIPRLTGDAAAIGTVIASATAWIQIGLAAATDEVVDGAVLISANGSGIMLQPRALGSWLVTGTAPGLSNADVCLTIATSFTAEHPSGAVFLASTTAETISTAFVRRSGSAAWDLVTADSEGVESLRLDGISDSDLRVHLAALSSR